MFSASTVRLGVLEVDEPSAALMTPPNTTDRAAPRPRRRRPWYVSRKVILPSWSESKKSTCFWRVVRDLPLRVVIVLPRPIPSLGGGGAGGRPGRRAGYGGRRRPGDSEAHKAYRASSECCRY